METVKAYSSATFAARAVSDDGACSVLFAGDCLELIKRLPNESISLTISSPPYCMGKVFDECKTVEGFIAQHEKILPEVARVTRRGGSICWQVGYHAADSSVYPLDVPVFQILSRIPEMVLRNRIIWTYGHGLHHVHRFDGRHETVLWFTKGSDYTFDLDAVRVPQKYPGKKKSSGPRKGQYSCNPKGKNPGDVWDIPNVKSHHVEKLGHPCQFPVGLADRLVRALCPDDGWILDPFMGTASTGVAAILNGRRFLGAEIKKRYFNLSVKRLARAHAGTEAHRPVDQPIFVPGPGLAVARRPDDFLEQGKP